MTPPPPQPTLQELSANESPLDIWRRTFMADRRPRRAPGKPPPPPRGPPHRYGGDTFMADRSWTASRPGPPDLSYIVKLAPILCWALPAGPAGCLPASSQEPPTGWIPDTRASSDIISQ
ncbi:hypothetical protein DSO57_1039207 [Entomophthora muscae]|uniref:Uncharacterized protein n=1 Tax=Entomophthora muscae TaxID=34485 RepID=A0ACC2SBL2_9FUNG|nr:hypothetical protein DSO57_1039207 [Entomophthora muscae]